MCVCSLSFNAVPSGDCLPGEERAECFTIIVHAFLLYLVAIISPRKRELIALPLLYMYSCCRVAIVAIPGDTHFCFCILVS